MVFSSIEEKKKKGGKRERASPKSHGAPLSPGKRIVVRRKNGQASAKLSCQETSSMRKSDSGGGEPRR